MCKSTKRIIVILILLLVIFIVLYKLYYNKYLAGCYNFTTFLENYNPDKVSKIEIGIYAPPIEPYNEMYMVTIKDRKDIKRIADVLDKMKFKEGGTLQSRAGETPFWVKCYNKNSKIVLQMTIYDSQDNGIYCLIFGKSYININSRYVDKLKNIYLDIRGEIPE